MALTKTTLQSSAYTEIYNVINNRVNVKDPRNASSTTPLREFVYDSDPFEKGLDFSGMPYIILMLPQLVQSNHSINGKVKLLTWTQRIIVRTVQGGSSGSNPDAGRTDILNISDDLHETFNKTSVRQSLQVVLANNMMLNTINNDNLSLNQRTVYESEFELTYDTRFTVAD